MDSTSLSTLLAKSGKRPLGAFLRNLNPLAVFETVQPQKP
jgi:hypothetical protein